MQVEQTDTYAVTANQLYNSKIIDNGTYFTLRKYTYTVPF